MKPKYPTRDLILTDPPIRITVPAQIPSNERADALRQLYKEHVKPVGRDPHWKGPCAAEVPASIADDVRAAMDFMGSLVDDERALSGGRVRLYSEGYWAHGF